MHHAFSIATILLIGLALAFTGPHANAANPNEFLEYSANGLPGRLYVPPDAMQPTTPRPLVVFLHGAGEIGSNNVTQVNGNIDNLFDEVKDRGAFLYAPQASGSWASVSRTSLVMDMVDQAIAAYSVDPNRIYVTGLSMGGGGTWNMLSRHSERIAAGVPIAAISPSADFQPSNLIGLPTWAFHSRSDNVVPEQATREVINRILVSAGKPAEPFPPSRMTLELFDEDVNLRYTEWPTGGHGIWGRVYADTQLRDWMFSQSLTIPEPCTIVLALWATATVLTNRSNRG